MARITIEEELGRVHPETWGSTVGALLQVPWLLLCTGAEVVYGLGALAGVVYLQVLRLVVGQHSCYTAVDEQPQLCGEPDRQLHAHTLGAVLNVVGMVYIFCRPSKSTALDQDHTQSLWQRLVWLVLRAMCLSWEYVKWGYVHVAKPLAVSLRHRRWVPGWSLTRAWRRRPGWDTNELDDWIHLDPDAHDDQPGAYRTHVDGKHTGEHAQGWHTRAPPSAERYTELVNAELLSSSSDEGEDDSDGAE